MAEGDIFKAVPQNTTASKREALRALAQGGTAGKQAYEQSLAASQQDRSKLFGDILDRATAINAPAGTAEQLQGEAGRGVDARTQALTGASSSNQALMGAISAANRNYFDQVNAALPIVQARSQQAREERAAKEAQQAEAMTPQGIMTMLGGVGATRTLLENAPRGRAAEYLTTTDPATGKTTSYDPINDRANPFINTIQQREQTGREAAEDQAERLGLPRGYGRLVDENAPEESPTRKEAAAKKANGTVEDFEGSRAYVDARDTLEFLMTEGPDEETGPLSITRANEELRRRLIKNFGHDFPALRKYLLELYR